MSIGDFSLKHSPYPQIMLPNGSPFPKDTP